MLKLLRSVRQLNNRTMGNAVQSLVKAQLDSGNFENCGFQGILNVK